MVYARDTIWYMTRNHTQVHIRLLNDIVRRLDDAAEVLGTSRSGLVTAAVEHMLPAMEKAADDVQIHGHRASVKVPTPASGPTEVPDQVPAEWGPAEEIQQITPEEVRKPEGKRHWHRFDLQKPIINSLHGESGEMMGTFECRAPLEGGQACRATKVDKVHPDYEEITSQWE